MTEKKAVNDPKKVVAVPVDSGPFVSQAGPEAADASAAAVPTPDAPIALSQIPSTGWSQGNLPRRS